ncbi:MAG: efflux RND transporter periplasmic adaptor subunit [Pontiellaceae bacterium]|jgi:cobalt-zinc-cadmium efflux system membrane fusion protein|nr:efflux RND transporter periplasmic adaptor subunit [Pontiellaceae bacterium]
MKKIRLLFTLVALNLFAQHEGHDPAAEASGHGAEASALEIKMAAGGLIERQVTFPAEVRINRDRFAAVSPRYAGLVRELRAEPGNTVKLGDVLAVLENRETLTIYTLTAPLAGTVISKNVSVGESAGEDTVLFEIADLSTVWVEVNVFPQYQQVVRPGSSVQLIAPDGDTAQTVIEYVSPLVSPETRTFKARCVLNNSGKDFAPGSFVRAQIRVESVQAAVRVEKEAVQTVSGATIVFIQDEHGTEPRDVQTGLSDGSYVEIKTGLQAGEKYVAHGAFELKAELITSGIDPHAGCAH